MQPVSLLLLDINMPIMDGMEATKLIKEKYKEINERLQSSGLDEEESDDDEEEKKINTSQK